MKEIESNYKPSEEGLKSKERLVVRFSGITISGRSGTGKTVSAEDLADLYSIPHERNIKTGQLMRKITGSGQISTGFMERDMEIDKKLDKMQREIILNSSPKNPFVLEGRLAGLIASEEKLKNPNLNVVSILFVAPSEIRIKRIFKRHVEDSKEKILILEADLNNALLSMASPEHISSILTDLNEEKKKAGMTLNDVGAQEKEREEKDLARWRKLYPRLGGIDPFNPANMDKQGKPIYDLIVNTKAPVNQVINEIHQKLKLEHFVISRDDFGPGDAGERSFQTIAQGATCEAYKDKTKKETCGKFSIGTVDIDISANLELFPYCGEQHAKQLEKDLILELKEKGKITVPGRNGFGRN